MVNASSVFSTFSDVVDAPRPGQDRSPQGVDIERGKRALHVDGAEAVALALADGEGDEEAAPVAVEIGGRRDDAGIGIAVLKIELTQQLAVEAQAVGVVDIGALEEAEKVRLRRRDHEAELRIAEGLVANEIDGLDLGGRSLIDLEHDVDAVVVEIDDLGIDGGGVIALPAIDIEDALDVGLDASARIDRAGLELNLGCERVVLDLAIPFERDAGDDRVFLNDDDDGRALAPMRTSWNRPVANSAFSDSSI